MRRFPLRLVAAGAAASLGLLAAGPDALAASATTRAKTATTRAATGKTIGRDATPTTTIYQGPIPGVTTIAARRLADFVAAQPFLTVLAQAIDRAGLEGELNKGGPYTLFAPDDAAFSRLTKAQFDALFADKKRLRSVVRHHVVKGQVDALTLIMSSPTLRDLDGRTVRVVKKAGVRGVRVDGALLIGSNLVATNGLVHIVDTVIGVGTPPVPATTTTVRAATTSTRPR